ncbi:hypothetical protein C8Q75DRAFT_791015 [Abortiporus biennis]|nr:hypothetical protein C8Q75DRAFT_791015 [Abortiporus biennis]
MTSTYFNFPDADLVLRSSCPDVIEFRVHRCILSAASPFFRQMFTLPQSPQPDAESPIPTIDVSENSGTVETLLRFVYPMVDPTFDSLNDVIPVLEAATKYDMTFAIESLRRTLVRPEFVKESPMRVFAIACRFDLEEEIRVASRHTLNINLLQCPLSEDLKHITAYDYHRLLNLHDQRAEAAVEVLARIPVPDDVKCMMCNGTHYGILIAPKWWDDYRQRAMEELKERPTTAVIFTMPFIARSAQAGCQRCAESIIGAQWFFDRLRKEIDSLPSTI